MSNQRESVYFIREQGCIGCHLSILQRDSPVSILSRREDWQKPGQNVKDDDIAELECLEDVWLEATARKPRTSVLHQSGPVERNFTIYGSFSING